MMMKNTPPPHQTTHIQTISDNITIHKTEIENTIAIPKDCGRRITDSLIGRNVEILAYEQNIPKGPKLILGDMAKITL